MNLSPGNPVSPYGESVMIYRVELRSYRNNALLACYKADRRAVRALTLAFRSLARVIVYGV
jgi:hypothetical protein